MDALERLRLIARHAVWLERAGVRLEHLSDAGLLLHLEGAGHGVNARREERRAEKLAKRMARRQAKRDGTGHPISGDGPGRVLAHPAVSLQGFQVQTATPPPNRV